MRVQVCVRGHTRAPEKQEQETFLALTVSSKLVHEVKQKRLPAVWLILTHVFSKPCSCQRVCVHSSTSIRPLCTPYTGSDHWPLATRAHVSSPWPDECTLQVYYSFLRDNEKKLSFIFHRYKFLLSTTLLTRVLTLPRERTHLVYHVLFRYCFFFQAHRLLDKLANA
jgi:hypothetical protein